jgi:hypothetical protein
MANKSEGSKMRLSLSDLLMYPSKISRVREFKENNNSSGKAFHLKFIARVFIKIFQDSV